jgi:hypothetical protein
VNRLLLFTVPVLLLFTMPLAHAGFDERYKIWDGVKITDEVEVEYSCNPLDLMCRQLEHETKLHEDKVLSEQAFYNNGRLVNPEADRMSTFDKQMKSLESTVKFLERFNLPIPDYLNHNSCVPLCWNELSSFWK